jgi:DNA-binding transcriptional LysR family regulator
MRFKGLDLNLLVVLDVLLERQNVTRAAEQLNTTQPAISAALRRLRDHFGDMLLAQNGKQMLPTAYALALREPLRALLSDANALVSIKAGFEPATSRRNFRIMASDFVASAILGEWFPGVRKIAPDISFTVSPPGDASLGLLDSGELDLFISPQQFLSAMHPARLLFEDRHVVAGWSENPLIREPVTRQTLVASKFIAAQIGRDRRSFAADELAECGITMRIAMGAAYFSIVADLLEGTDCLAIIPERYARRAARHRPIAWQPLPVPIAPLHECVQYHRTRAEDPGLKWLIGNLMDSIGQSDRAQRTEFSRVPSGLSTPRGHALRREAPVFAWVLN